MDWVLGIRSEFLTIIMKTFTFLGDEEFFLIFLPLAYWLWRQKGMGRLGMVLLATFVINDFLKSVFQDPRPDTSLHLVEASGWNFPSGHAQSAMVLWGWLAWEIRRSWSTIAAAVIIAGIAFSRLYLGVHDLNGVLGGLLVGALTIGLYGWLLTHQPTTWQDLGPSRQSMITLVVLLGCYMLFPEHGDQAIKGGAAFIGFTAGVLHEQHHIRSELSHRIGHSIARAVSGLIGLALIYLGLKQVFISIGYQTTMATFIRYALLGGWIGIGVPYLAVHLGWSETRD